MTFTGIITFFGGIGLFLLGMKLMTDGLKVAAGPRLRTILMSGTTTRLRALGSGALITALVQSSSMVTFATIGFVNAGLLNLMQATGVIYGANLGTTVTSWLVALVGFKLDLKALALPAIAAGMALRVFSGHTARGALGEALAGFGVFFLGIDILKEAFAGVDLWQPLEQAEGLGGMLLGFVAAGFVMTLVTQSSSAALVITLTAAASGFLSLHAAAAVVIGANVGTTTTAVFAVIGATAAARRAAAMHVLFNLVTMVVALAGLRWLLAVVEWTGDLLAGGFQVATALALFHTLTKLVGVAVMWPMTGRLTRLLEARFKSVEEDAGRLQYLDANVARTPSLALNALVLELTRVRDMARSLALDAMDARPDDWPGLRTRQQGLRTLMRELGEFAGQIGGSEDEAEQLARVLRTNQYLADVIDRTGEIASLQETAGTGGHDDLEARVTELKRMARETIEGSVMQEAFLERYEEVKALLLRAGGAGRVPFAGLVGQLDLLSAVRRMVDQSVKADRILSQLRQGLETGQPRSSNESTARSAASTNGSSTRSAPED